MNCTSSYRRNLSGWGTAAAVLLLGAVMAAAAEPAVLFKESFDQLPHGKPPATFMVVDGAFTVKGEGAQRWLELPGTPLENFGVLFGPQAASNLCVTARIQGESTGRRHPMFAVGLGGIGGLKLWVAPGREQLELHQGEKMLATVPLRWKSGVWTHLKLRLTRNEAGRFRAEGKLWLDGEAEPAAWTLAADLKDNPPPGRASVWGAPISDKPIRFDDLLVIESRP